MAQNEIQRYYSTSVPAVNSPFFDDVRQPLNTMYENHRRLERLSNFLNSAAAADFNPALEAGTLTDLGSLRTQINTYLAAQTTIDMIDEIKSFIRI